MPRDKTRYRSSSRRRSTSESSDSSYERHKSKSKRRHRSRSKDSESSRRRRRSHSSSRDRYSSKSKKRSSSKARSKKMKRRSKSRERSPDYREKYKSSKSSHKKSSRRRSRTSDSRSSQSSEESANFFPPRKALTDDIESKVEQAIKAAEAVGLTMTKLPKYEVKECVIKADMPTIHDRNLLEELNKDSFASKPFVSSRNKKFSDKIVIDLDNEIVQKVPEIEIKEEESILNLDELPSDEELKEMWIKKLFLLRKKLLEG